MDVRTELHDALDEKDFPPDALLHRAMAQLDRPAARRPRYIVPASIATGVMAAVLVATLVAVNFNTRTAQEPPLPTATTIDNLAGYQFVSAQVGWVHLSAGGGDVIAKTEDGGRTWREQLKMVGLERTPTMQWIDADHGVLIGQNEKQGVVMRSDDSGANWRSFVVPVPVVEPGRWVDATGYFVDPSHGWVLFRHDPCAGSDIACPPGVSTIANFTAYSTEDGGGSWTKVGTLPTLPAPELTVRFVSSRVGVVVSGPAIATTRNGGRSWTLFRPAVPLPTCPSTDCRDVFVASATMFDESNGVAVLTVLNQSQNFAVLSRVGYATDDGGKTWHEAPMLLHRVEVGVVIFLSVSSLIDITPSSIPVQPGWYLASGQFVGVEYGWVSMTSSAQRAVLGLQQNSDRFQMASTTDGGVTWHVMRLPNVA